MTPLLKITDPARADRSGKGLAKVHYEADDGQVSLCGAANIFKVMDGEKMRVWYRVKQPVTCQPCVKKLEVRVRDQLAGLKGEQLEDLLAHIDTFRSRFGAAR